MHVHGALGAARRAGREGEQERCVGVETRDGTIGLVVKQPRPRVTARPVARVPSLGISTAVTGQGS